MTTAVLILAAWSVLAGLVCAFVAGASRRAKDVMGDKPLPVWLESFERPAETASVAVPEPAQEARAGSPIVV